MNPLRLTDEECTRVYKQANGEDVGKAQPLTTARIFIAMRAAADAQLAKLREQKPVAHTAGDDIQRFIRWAPDVAAFDYPIDTPLFAAPVPGGQDERIKMLEEIAREKHAAAMHALTVRMDLEDSIARLKVALRFYADVADYKAPFTSGMGKLWHDCGDTARRALASQDENKEQQG